MKRTQGTLIGMLRTLELGTRMDDVWDYLLLAWPSLVLAKVNLCFLSLLAKIAGLAGVGMVTRHGQGWKDEKWLKARKRFGNGPGGVDCV